MNVEQLFDVYKVPIDLKAFLICGTKDGWMPVDVLTSSIDRYQSL